ncbi:MAG: crossover junction endodeoxyribonuclease RuvC [Actinomycetia bacterium]|nr:crossover junction endodeoxyribonuclease RuvC [Actinomycetes bacterium]
MIILGIDPGTASTGFGLIDYDGSRIELKEFGCIRTGSKMHLSERLRIIYEKISGIINEFEPEIVVIEQLFFNTNAKTALAVGQARGVAMLAAALSEKEVQEYTPLQVKQALVGYGRAHKKQVQYMVRSILKLNFTPKPDDAADALGLAICHAHSIRYKKGVSKADSISKR